MEELFKQIENKYKQQQKTGISVITFDFNLTYDQIRKISEEFPLATVITNTPTKSTVTLAPRKGTLRKIQDINRFIVNYLRDNLLTELQEYVTIQDIITPDNKGKVTVVFTSKLGDVRTRRIFSKHFLEIEIIVEDENNVSLLLVDKSTTIKSLTDKGYKEEKIQDSIWFILKSVVKYLYSIEDYLCSVLETKDS